MITTHLHWSDDISKAPKDWTRILALTNDGEIIVTQWIKDRVIKPHGVLFDGMWIGLKHGENPLMWAPWPDAGELMLSYEASRIVEAREAAE